MQSSRQHVAGLLAFSAAGMLAGPALAGAIFLTGHDPDFHAQPGFGNGGKLLQVGINYATSGGDPDTFGGKFLWVESDRGFVSGHLRGEDGLNAIGLTEGVDYDTATASQFSALTTAQLAGYTAIGVASSFGGKLTRDELDALIARSDDIADFVNAGGGIFASSECFPCGGNLLAGTTDPDLFGYLPVDVTSIGADPDFTATAFGLSLGLTNTDLNDPTHNSFGLVGGLNVVDVDEAGNATTLAGIVTIDDGGFNPVPEPSTLAIVGLGLFGFALARRRRGQAA